MKPFFYLVIIIWVGCKNPVADTQPPKTDTTVVESRVNVDKRELYATIDSVIIASPYFDTIVYPKKEFNEIVENFPTLTCRDSFPEQPDISYALSGMFRKFTDSAGNEKTISFSSEVGRDTYYILYAYFLQKQHGAAVFAGRRDTLIRIYQEINDIFGWLQHGGTYFGHQYNRINGYAEYGLHQYKHYYAIDGKTYNIARQKKLYLGLLRQKISDETQNDESLLPGDKTDQLKRVFKIVKQLDQLITDNFYLEKAQEFQYSNY